MVRLISLRIWSCSSLSYLSVMLLHVSVAVIVNRARLLQSYSWN